MSRQTARNETMSGGVGGYRVPALMRPAEDGAIVHIAAP